MSINYSIVALQNNSYLHYIGIELNSGFFSKKKVKKRVYLKELEKSYPAPLLQSKSKKSSQQPVKNLALSSPKEISQPPVQPVPQPIAEKESPPSQQTISQSPLQRTSLPPVQKLPQSSPEKISQPPVQPAPQSTIQNQIQPIQQKIIKLSNSSRREFTFNSISFIQSNQSIKPILYHYDIEFKYNHYGLNKKAVFVLEKIIPLTRQYSNYHILIEGHTDSRGDSNFNRTLSEQRALSVSKYLLRNGIKKERLSIKGWGSSHPYLPNLNFDGTDSTNGRLKNRRFEITLIKPGK